MWQCNNALCIRGSGTPFVFFLLTQNKQNVTLSRCHVVTFLKMNKGYRDSKNSIYKYIYLYILFFEHFSPLVEVQKQKRDNVTMWQRDKEPSHQLPYILQRTLQSATNQPFILIVTSALQLFNPCPLVTFYCCQRRLHPLFHPPFSRKKTEKKRRDSKENA